MELCYLEYVGIPMMKWGKEASNREPVRDMRPQNALAEAATPKTKPLYMEGTYILQCKARVKHVERCEGSLAVELDQTVFHPQGGGQPSDTGLLIAEGLPTLKVIFVSKKDGTIRHDCEASSDCQKKWVDMTQRGSQRDSLEVLCQVDEEKRRLCARLHSAGHLLDVAVFSLGFRWQAGKGYHFQEGPYVEYIPTENGRQVDPKDAKAKASAIEEISEKMKELIAKKVPTEVGFVDGMRTITMDGVSCGCGGTHVEFSSEIGEVLIKKIQAKQGNIRVSYAVS